MCVPVRLFVVVVVVVVVVVFVVVIVVVCLFVVDVVLNSFNVDVVIDVVAVCCRLDCCYNHRCHFTDATQEETTWCTWKLSLKNRRIVALNARTTWDLDYFFSGLYTNCDDSVEETNVCEKQ